MKLVFFGSSRFAVGFLQRLIHSNHEVSLCITRPDRAKGRGLEIKPTPIKEVALAHSLNLLQPENVNSPTVINRIVSYGADVFIVISYGEILHKELLNKVTYSLGVHPSLLPKYRGASPIKHAIMNGEEVTGVTVFKMNEEMDSGEIVQSKQIKIDPNENALDLSRRLSDLGAELLLKILDKIKAGEEIILTPQNSDRVSYAFMLSKADGLIDWTAPAITMHNKIRALFPWPGTFTFYLKKDKKKMLKIWESECYSVEGSFEPGEILDIKKNGLVVGTSEGMLLVKSVQAEGKQKISAYNWVQGSRMNIGDRFVS